MNFPVDRYAIPAWAPMLVVLLSQRVNVPAGWTLTILTECVPLWAASVAQENVPLP